MTEKECRNSRRELSLFPTYAVAITDPEVERLWGVAIPEGNYHFSQQDEDGVLIRREQEIVSQFPKGIIVFPNGIMA